MYGDNLDRVKDVFKYPQGTVYLINWFGIEINRSI